MARTSASVGTTEGTMLGVGPLCLPALGTLAAATSETAGMGVVMVTRCVGGAESWTLIYQHDREQPAPQYLPTICWLVGLFIYKPAPDLHSEFMRPNSNGATSVPPWRLSTK